MTSVYAHPLDGGPALLTPPDPEAAVRAAAARSVLRWAAGREDEARTVLTALGLLPDPEHKPTRWNRGDHR